MIVAGKTAGSGQGTCASHLHGLADAPYLGWCGGVALAAGVVEMVASLALFFIANIAYRTGAEGTFCLKFDITAWVLLAAALALLRCMQGVIPLMAVCALTGAGMRLSGWA